MFLYFIVPRIYPNTSSNTKVELSPPTYRYQRLISRRPVVVSHFSAVSSTKNKTKKTITALQNMIVVFVSLLQQRPAALHAIIKLGNSNLKWLNLPFTTPDIRIGSLLFVLWSCSLDFKVAWLCCCNFHFISKTDSSLQLMNVTHLSRLAYPLLGRGGGGRGLKEKKNNQKRKKVNLEGVDICSVLPYPFKLESWGKC